MIIQYTFKRNYQNVSQIGYSIFYITVSNKKSSDFPNKRDCRPQKMAQHLTGLSQQVWGQEFNFQFCMHVQKWSWHLLFRTAREKELKNWFSRFRFLIWISRWRHHLLIPGILQDNSAMFVLIKRIISI